MSVFFDRLWRGALPVALAFLAPLTAHAQNYRFTQIADTRNVFSTFGPPALNDSGTVGFQASLQSGEAGVFQYQAGTTTPIAQTGPFLDFIGFRTSLNNGGASAFAGDMNGFSGQGIFRGEGTSMVTIADSATDRFDFVNFAPSINDKGEVAFIGEKDASQGFLSGVFAGDGGPLTIKYDESDGFSFFSGDPSLNNSGKVAFNAQRTDGRNGLFLGDGGTLTTIALDDGLFSDLNDQPSLNNSGDVAFEGFLAGGGTGIFVYRDGSLVTIADGSGAFAPSGFGTPSLNDNGTVAFLGTLNGFQQGIFVGSDPVTDRVILAGDTLFGKVTVGFDFFREGLNNQGQLAFRAFFEDGTESLILATPNGIAAVPEPGAIAFGLLAGGGVLGLVARKRSA